jgi:peptidyl-prolyl cis-trans isomerase C
MNAARLTLLTAGLATMFCMMPGVSVAATKSTSKASPRGAVPESLQVLVRVGREAITRADVNRRLEELPEQIRSNYTTPEGRKQLLDRLVEERVWMQEARKHGVDTRPDVQRQIEQTKRDLVMRTYLTEMMSANPAVTDSEARAYYDAHLNDYLMQATVSVRHIQSKTEAESKRVLAMAKAPGADFAKLAQKFSADTLTRATGGALGTVTHDGFFGSLGAQPALAESAFRIPEGKVGGPFKTDKGWHVLKVDAKTAQAERPFEQVRQLIQRQLSSQKAQEFYNQKLDEARHDIGVKPDSGAIRSFYSAKKSARDMFKDAQEAGPPENRIAKYREMLAQYPKSDVSAQAQFMIGFVYSEELKNYDEAEKEFRRLLEKYPDSELAASAKWMIEHMRTEDAPDFAIPGADSTGNATASKKGARGKS